MMSTKVKQPKGLQENVIPSEQTFTIIEYNLIGPHICNEGELSNLN